MTFNIKQSRAKYAFIIVVVFKCGLYRAPPSKSARLETSLATVLTKLWSWAGHINCLSLIDKVRCEMPHDVFPPDS